VYNKGRSVGVSAGAVADDDVGSWSARVARLFSHHLGVPGHCQSGITHWRPSGQMMSTLPADNVIRAVQAACSYSQDAGETVTSADAEAGDRHQGGTIVFDGAGNLLLSTSDDTNPFFSDGYAPLDNRPSRNPLSTARNPPDAAGNLCAEAFDPRALHRCWAAPGAARNRRCVRGVQPPDRG